MSPGEDTRVAHEYDLKIRAVANQLAILQKEKMERLHNLQTRCLDEHGSHDDNNGFMHGFCTRCGAYLG